MPKLTTTKIDLLLLGMLLDRPMHGYELHQQIQAEGIDTWFNVSMAGVYYSLGKLRDQGLVVESRQQGGRSTRKSIYHLTEEGRMAFFASMEDQALSREKIYFDYGIAIYLLNKLPLQRAIPLLEQRQAFLAEQIQEVQATQMVEEDDSHAPLKLAILDHNRRSLEMEQAWLADVIRQIQGEEKGQEAQAGEQRGLMILSGDLHHFHLPDLIRLIASGQHSGTLAVTDGAVVRTISFDEGRPVCASCLRQDEPPAPPPSPEDVLKELCDLFRWQEGEFTFNQEMGCEEWCTRLTLSVEDLLLLGCRWVDNWTIIQQLVPSADAIFELGFTPQHLERLALMPPEEQIAAAVDGVKDVATIARELGLTLFEASRSFYCLAAVGVVRTADLDKIRLRRVFREISELMCNSTVAWRTSTDDLSCEDEVNQKAGHLPVCLNHGRIEDRADPQLKTDDLVKMYREFLLIQVEVVSHRFGREKTHQSFERTLRQLAPDLQGVAKHYGFDRALLN